MESYDAEFAPPPSNPGLWVPGDSLGELTPEIAAQVNEILPIPEIERHNELNWVQKFPIESGGLFLKSSAIKRPTGNDDWRWTYSLAVLRWSIHGMNDVGGLTRDEFIALRNFMTTVIEDSGD